jgi:hypothetical protein
LQFEFTQEHLSVGFAQGYTVAVQWPTRNVPKTSHPANLEIWQRVKKQFQSMLFGVFLFPCKFITLL